MFRLSNAYGVIALTCLSGLGVACSGAVDRGEVVGATEGALSSTVTTTIVGRVTMARSSPLRGAGASTTQLVIRDASRASYVLVAPPSLVASLGGSAALAGHQVKATGTLSGKTFTATSLAFDTTAASARALAPLAVTGPSKVLTLMCRFSGTADEAPAPEGASFFTTALDGRAPHLGNYFNTVSHGKVTLDGSQVLGSTDGGWISIRPSTDYADGAGGFVTAFIVDDCLASANDAWPDALPAALQSASAVAVVLSHNLVSNRVFLVKQDLGDFGLDTTIPVTVVPPFTFRQQEGFAKSIGFALGMGESTTGSLDPTVSPPADSMWDLMSAGGTCSALDPVLGCVAARPLAAHLDQVGWIAAAEKVDVASNDQTITLVAPASTSGTRLVTVPLSGGRYLAIETRSATTGDYDANLPGSGVVVHDVVHRTAAEDSPFVAHQDAVLAAGGSYTDPTTGAFVTVQALGTASATVHVVHDTPLTVTQTTFGGSYSLDGVTYSGSQTIGARPNSQSQIVLQPASGWLGAATGCSSFDGTVCTVVMDQPRSVTVSFHRAPPPPPPPPPGDDDPVPPVCKHKPWLPQCSPP